MPVFIGILHKFCTFNVANRRNFTLLWLFVQLSGKIYMLVRAKIIKERIS